MIDNNLFKAFVLCVGLTQALLPQNTEFARNLKRCYQADSWSVNPQNDSRLNQILQGLVSPAPQSYVVLSRALANNKNNTSFCQHLLKRNHQIVWLHDATWTVAVVNEEEERIAVTRQEISPTSLARAQSILATEESSVVDDLVMSLESHLDYTLGTDIRGRTAADVCFTLSLAGVTQRSIYERLVLVLTYELERLEHRQSRPKDIYHILEKLATSGIPPPPEVYAVARRILGSTNTKELDLLSDRPLLWLWRYSSRRAKLKAVHRKLQMPTFEDMSKPLIVDIGCGMGVSLIGLACSKLDNWRNLQGIGDCNLLGIDLGDLRYAQGIAQRWNLESLRFIQGAAQDLTLLRDYPGPIVFVLIQFPSPFAATSGNTQLPSMDDFMVSPLLLETVSSLLSAQGKLLLQSNCEDVALYMHQLALATNDLEAIEFEHYVRQPSSDITQRTQKWLETGPVQRAVGPTWSNQSLLPPRCTTETEVSCRINHVPVHSCLFQKSG